MTEPTTYDYDYGYGYLTANVTANVTDSSTPVGPCSLENVNILGAGLSYLFYFMFLFSLFGNGLLLFIIHRFEKLTTVTNILLVNLVVSSLIFMSSLPFIGVYEQLSDWIFGEAMCKIVRLVYYLGFYSSVLFLTLLTFDRHLAIVYSMGPLQVRSRRYAVVSCVVVWLISILACIRPMILYTTFKHWDNNNKMYCEEHLNESPSIDAEQLRKAGFYLQLVVFLIFPLAVVIYCYIRIAITVLSSQIVTKFKTVRLIFVIVLLFFVCWIPFNIAMLMNNDATTCEERRKTAYALEVTRIISYIYFCINPIFYTFVGKKFQNYFRQLLVKRFPGLKKHDSVSQNSGINMSTKSTLRSLEKA